MKLVIPITLQFSLISIMFGSCLRLRIAHTYHMLAS